MFIIRSAFWITAAAFLLPLGEGAPVKGNEGALVQQQEISTLEALHAAQGTVSDLTGFCGRQPQVCETGTKALLVVRETAKYGMKKAYEWVNKEDGQSLQPRQLGAQKVSLNMNSRIVVAESSTETTGSVNTKASQNTLRKDDLAPAWGGPIVNG